MSFIKSTLLRDEKIIHFSHPHWIIFVPGFFVFLLVGAILYYGPLYLPGSEHFRLMKLNIWDMLAIIFGFVGLYWMLSAAIRFYFSEYAVTDKRVIMKVGMIQRDTSEIFLSKLEAIDVDQSILGRALGYGTIALIGTGGTRDVYSDIPKPFYFRRIAMQQVDNPRR